MLRHAMTNNVFCEPEAGKVAHTANSALFVRERGIRDWVGYTTEESFRCAASLIEANERWGSSIRADQSAYQIAFNTDLPMFEHMSQFPERAERFANTMTDMVSTDAYNIRHLISGFDWAQLPEESTVVDVSPSRCRSSLEAFTDWIPGWWVCWACLHRNRGKSAWFEVHCPGST